MLNKRIDLGSIPVGLYDAGEDIVKGSAVVLHSDHKVYKPANQAEADAPMGFAFLVTDTDLGSDAENDTVPAGKKVIVYTLVKNNRWGTTEFTGTPAVGDELVVGFTAGTDAGKLRVRTAGEVTANRVTLFKVARSYTVGSATKFVDVDVK